MNSVLFGADNTPPSTSVVNYNPWVTSHSGGWSATLNIRQIAISEDITITKLIFYIDTAPGAGKSFVFAVNDDGTDTAASVTFNDAVTLEQTWTGSVAIAAGSFVALSSTPTGTPSASTNTYWVMEYTTTGQKFLMMGGSGTAASASATEYGPPCGWTGSAWGTAATDRDIVIPTGCTVTKLTASTPDGSPGASKSYDISLRSNDTTDNLTTNVGDAETSDSVTGSIALSAGDTIVIKKVANGTPTARRIAWCMTIVPDTDGEVIYGFGGTQAPSTTATNYEQLHSNGNNGWNSTESTRYTKPPGVDFKKMYVRLQTDPSPGNRTFTLMDGGAATALTVNIAAGSTTGNDTAHTVAFTAGNTGTWRSTVASSPAASAGVHIGYVMAVTQPAGGATPTGNDWPTFQSRGFRSWRY